MIIFVWSGLEVRLFPIEHVRLTSADHPSNLRSLHWSPDKLEETVLRDPEASTANILTENR
jgi:hypothetical protein